MEKAAFYKYDEDQKKFSTTVYMNVLFNPSTYTVNSTANYGVDTAIDARKDTPTFSKLGMRQLSMDLHFDSMNKPAASLEEYSKNFDKPTNGTTLSELFTGKIADVKASIDKLHKLIELENSSASMPPVVAFCWGNFCFRGVITSMRETYTSFLSNGRPIQADVAITMLEFLPSAKAASAGSSEKNAQETIPSSSVKDFSDSAEKIMKGK